MGSQITLEKIKARCETDSGCWVWEGAVSSTGYPIIHQRPGTCKLVRRVVAELKGTPPEPRQPVVVKCGEKCCCNPDHIRLSTVKNVGRKAAKEGAFSKLDRRMKIANAKRNSPNAKLDIQKARDIRLSEKSSAALAVEYGVNLSLIKAIRAGRAWRDYSSPFAGLGAR